LSTLLGRVIKPLLERYQMLLNCCQVVTSLLRGSLQLRGLSKVMIFSLNRSP
jgi:hypothetical protein